jgi:hypothetical protein
MGAATPAIQVNHPPQDAPRQFGSAQWQELVKPASAGIAGFLSDDDSGHPLEGVRIAVDETRYEALSDAGGFFKLYCPPLKRPTRQLRGLHFPNRDIRPS